MANFDRKLQASAFVRRNSGKIAAELPHNQLAQLLHKSEQNDAAIEDIQSNRNSIGFNQWANAHGSESWEVEDLFKEFEQLAKTWQKFQVSHARFQDVGGKAPPNFHDLQSVMRTTLKDWDVRGDSGLSRVKNSFLSFSDTLLSFSDLFSIIPDGDKYVSLLTGVLSTIVKAAGRRTEIAEGFSSALADIGNAMCLGTAILEVHQNSDSIERLVILLHVRYSRFFCHFMDWHLGSHWDRIKSSLRNDYYTKEVAPQVADIKNICNRIESHARLITQRQVQITAEGFRQLHNQYKLDHQQRLFHDGMLTERLDTWDAKLQGFMELLIGHHCHNNVTAMVEHHRYDDDVENAKYTARRHEKHTEAIGNSPSQLLEGPVISDRNVASSTLVSTGTHGRDALEDISLKLLKYLPVTKAGTESSEDGNLRTELIPAAVVERLLDWAGSPRSEFLWILGVAFSSVNYSLLAALHIDNLAAVAKIPCISVFCTPDAEFEYPVSRDQSREMNMLIAILYTLIHRLTIIAGEALVDTHELTGIISSLNGQQETITKALKAIHMLLRHRSPLLIIILSGLDQVETDETEPYLKELIEIIHADIRPASRLKVLLGSEGYLRCGNDLDADECLDCALLPILRPGQALPGGRFVNEIDGDLFPTSY